MVIASSAAHEKINLLIIGTGMYVCGRGTDSYGTVLPAIMQCYQSGIIGKVLVASKRGESLISFERKVSHLREFLGTDFPYTPYPAQNSTNPGSYRDAIRDLPGPGAVIIVTPDHLHVEMALAAIESGKHVLVVKPLAPTVAEAYGLIRALEKAKVYGAVEFHKRWDWANLRLRHALEYKVIGEPLYFHVEYSQRKVIPTEIFLAWVNHTSVFQYLGVHYSDIIYFVTHDRPQRLIATGQKNWLLKRGVPTYDAIEVLIEWSEGFTSTILTNWIDSNVNSAMSHQMIKVIGTHGRFESDQTDRGVRVVTDSGGVEDINPYFCQPYSNMGIGHTEYRGYGIDSITQFVKDVWYIIQGAHSPEDFEGQRPTFRDALVATAIVEGTNLSLRHDSQWVYFDETLRPYLK